MSFEKFDDIKHLPLQVYNRVVMLHNLTKDSGEKTAKEYLGQFNEGERRQMFIINSLLKSKGPQETLKMVMEGAEIAGDI